jgi:glycosyltransferase involved in cell wall biosynthesis
MNKEINELIEREGVINIDANQNSKIGEDLYLGIINSHSDIICFLDDDDIFNETKLENVLEVFSRDPSLLLYINARTYANEDLTKIYHKVIGYDI